MKAHKLILLLFPVFFGSMVYSQSAGDKANAGFNITNIMIPVVIAVLGYISKSAYEIIVNRKKRKRELIENKLQYFYWPIDIRLKKNKETYDLLIKGKMSHDKSSDDYIIAHYVEKEVLLKNHEEILEIITKYRHLADTDLTFEKLTDDYIRHVTIYRGYLDAGINEYPGIKGNAPYPRGIDEYFFKKTRSLQAKLEKMTF
jgi:hypothetical protein